MIDGHRYIPIEVDWNDVKGNRFEFEYNKVFDIAWLYLMDDEDMILMMWEISALPLNY